MSLKVDHSQDKVPFSWEQSPGVSKEMVHKDGRGAYDTNIDTYTYTNSSRLEIVKVNHVQDTQLLPPPPCGFLPPQRSTSKKGLKKQDDPFFTAYKECTKSNNRGKFVGGSKDEGGGFGISKKISMFSCKHSCSVRDDSMIMMNSKNFILSKSQREKRDIHKG